MSLHIRFASWLRRLTLIASLAAVLWAAQGHAANTKEAVIAATKSLLAAKQPEAAIKNLDAAPELKDDVDASFLRGVAYQQLSTQSQDPAAQKQAVQAAERAYQQALKSSAPQPPPPPPPPKGAGGGKKPPADSSPVPVATTEHMNTQNAAVLNNLASLYASAGDDQQARRYYAQAVNSNDPRRGYYALNYAHYLESRDVALAIPMAQFAVQNSPQSKEARTYLGQLLWRNRIDAMLPYANDLSQHGFSDASINWAIKCLTAGNRPSEERRAWLVMLAHTAAMTARFDNTLAKLAADLEALQADADIGRGVAQLRLVLTAAPKNKQAVDWWSGQSSKVATLNQSPRDAMRQLLLALSERTKSQESDATEAYLIAGLELGEFGPDPDVFLRLVELYANRNQPEKLKTLMDRYQYELFSEKSMAYARGDWPLIYRMHVALGLTYAHMHVWTSNAQYQNALFQLESAEKAADRLNDQAKRANKPDRITLPPVAVARLAEGYESIHRQDLAFKAKLNGATNLQKYGFAQESDDVLRSLSEDQARALPANLKQRFDAIKPKTMDAR